MKVRVRDDDVLVAGIYYKSVFHRFCRIHEIIVNNGGLHVPAIMCNAIMDHPECITFIRHEMMKGNMRPELHCLDHIDYDILSESELDTNLRQCVDWFQDNLWTKPTIFYTPWGGDSPMIRAVAAKHGLTLGACTKLIRPFHVIRNPDAYTRDTELQIHWWDKKDRRTLEEALQILGRK